MSETNSKHTGGNWTARLGEHHFGNDGERYIVHDLKDHPHSQIAVVASQIERKRKTPYDAPDAERDANALLLAAAPELLAALEKINALALDGAITRSETGKPMWSLVDELTSITQSAIAKATP